MSSILAPIVIVIMMPFQPMEITVDPEEQTVSVLNADTLQTIDITLVDLETIEEKIRNGEIDISLGD